MAASPDAQGRWLDGMETWLCRRLAAIDARLDPKALGLSARNAKVDFCDPPKGEGVSRWSRGTNRVPTSHVRREWFESLGLRR